MPLLLESRARRRSKVEFLPEVRITQEQRLVIRADESDEERGAPARFALPAGQSVDRSYATIFRLGRYCESVACIAFRLSRTVEKTNR